MKEIKKGDRVFVKTNGRFGSVQRVYDVDGDSVWVRYDDATYEYVSPDDVILVEPDEVYTTKNGNVVSVYRPDTLDKVRSDFMKQKKDSLLKQFRKSAQNPEYCKKFTWSTKKQEEKDFDDDFRLQDEDSLIAISRNDLYYLLCSACDSETLKKAYDRGDGEDLDWDGISVGAGLGALIIWECMCQMTV